MPFVVTRSFHLDTWDESCRNKAKEFWQRQNFEFTESSDHMMQGKRGTLVQNFCCCDPSRVTSTLTITSLEPNKIDAAIVVNTTFQLWSDWDKAFVQLEMATFESYLLFDDAKETSWKEFRKWYNFAAVRAYTTFNLRGYRMTTKERTRFQEYLQLSMDL